MVVAGIQAFCFTGSFIWHENLRLSLDIMTVDTPAMALAVSRRGLRLYIYLWIREDAI